MNAHRRQGNSSFTLEMRMRHAKGGTRWIQLRASCVADADGKAIRCIGVVSDITGRKAQEAQHQSDEAGDAVTGLMLRNGFLTRLDGVLGVHADRSLAPPRRGPRRRRRSRARRHRQHGPPSRRQFLSQIARRLDHAAGPDDAVARLGTDEFAVLALGSRGDEDGAQVAQRIRDALTQPVAIGDREVYPAASIGLALIEPGHRFGGDVLREAEIAMYHAKRTGRGGFEIYQPQMKPRSADRLHHGHRSAHRARSRPDRDALPADRAPRRRLDRGLRSPDALAPSASAVCLPPANSSPSPKRPA